MIYTITANRLGGFDIEFFHHATFETYSHLTHHTDFLNDAEDYAQFQVSFWHTFNTSLTILSGLHNEYTSLD